MPKDDANPTEMILAHRCGGCGYDLSAIERTAQAEEAAGRARGFCVVTCPECGRSWHLSAVWLFGELNPRRPLPVGEQALGSQGAKAGKILLILALFGLGFVAIDYSIAGRPEFGPMTLLFLFGFGSALLLIGLVAIVDRLMAGPSAIVRFGFDREGVWVMNQGSESQCVALRGDWLVELNPRGKWLARLLIWERPASDDVPKRLAVHAMLRCRPAYVEQAKACIAAALGLAAAPKILTEAPASAESSSSSLEGRTMVGGGAASESLKATGEGSAS